MSKKKKRIHHIHLKQWFLDHKWVLLLILPFWFMDLAVRIYGNAIGFYPAFYLGPNVFTLLYCALLVGIISHLRRRLGKIIYIIMFIFFLIFCATQLIYYNLTNFYFSFSLLQMAGEGSDYILDTIKSTPPVTFIILVIIIATFITCYVISFHKHKEIFPEQTEHKNILRIFLLFLVFHLIAPFSLGIANSNLKWSSFRNARNVYNSYSDANKSLRVSGLFEYTFRNFYMTFLKPEEKMSEDEQSFLDEIYKSREEEHNNAYTGIFADKNLIFLQLEGMDTWMLTEETTPNLYALMQESMTFTDHYSMYTGGGSTFNSEFAVNTGFTTPISYTENVYTLNTNNFPHTMAKLFKEKDYTVNAFHMNSSEFYSRGVNYLSWGYDKYYGLADLEDVDVNDLSYELDRTLLENKTFYEAMFPKDQKFVDYIITYTPHTPFTTEKGVGELLAQMTYPDEDYSSMDEEAVAKMEAAETDYMVGLLMQALKDQNLYDNTVIVAYADHYLYTLNDKSILETYKEHADDNRINRTPFFIWTADSEYVEISKTNMQLHILPTVLNLFGISYDANWFLGTDILDDDYFEIAFFPDQTWYDGELYFSGKELESGQNTNSEELTNKNRTVMDLIRKNDLTLRYDYFKEIKE